jgi:hypothetical protein
MPLLIELVVHLGVNWTEFLQRLHTSKLLHRSLPSSKRLMRILCAIVEAASGGPIVDTAPLPARAQFLNVIESIFSGMARAIIHNSNYRSVEEAKGAINRYFDERNCHFREHPRRAGKRIWGKERVPPEFADGNCCKDPRFRWMSPLDWTLTWRSAIRRRFRFSLNRDVDGRDPPRPLHEPSAVRK